MARATPMRRVREQREPLSRERVLRAAIELADEAGIDALSMRRLGQALGVEAMSLYNHVANKDDILGGIVDMVMAEVELPDPQGDWKAELRRTAISAHDVLMRHSWAAQLMLAPGRLSETRMRYMEGILGCLRSGGFSPELTDRAYHVIESHISGFTLWQVGMTFSKADLPRLAADFLSSFPTDDYPYLVEHIHEHLKPSAPSGKSAFAFGLDLLLDGLDRMRSAA